MAAPSVPALRSSRAGPINGITGSAAVYRVRPRIQSANKIEELSLTELRAKIRRTASVSHLKCRPSRNTTVPICSARPCSFIFFSDGAAARIAQRYGVLRQRIQQILSTWKRRAIQMGYIQEIPPATPSRELGKLVQ
jgi:hypothetical protein